MPEHVKLDWGETCHGDLDSLHLSEAELRRGWVPLDPRSPLERGQLAVLLALLVLTLAAWALTIYQAQTMDMPMGVVRRGDVQSPRT